MREREVPPVNDGPEAYDPCLWWRRGRLELYPKHGLVVVMVDMEKRRKLLLTMLDAVYPTMDFSFTMPILGPKRMGTRSTVR